MVLRKPYAFLIKNFKLIHIILTVLMTMFFFRLKNINDFLVGYIDEGLYGRVSDVVGKYIGVWGYLLPILIIGVLSLIAYLLKMKEKPIKYYIITTIAYILEIILIAVANIILSTIQQGTATFTTIQIFSDLLKVLQYTPIPFLVVALVRGVGFNIKQFNFKKDLIELNINEEDSEEFELEVELDTEDIKAKFNRKLRFIKYVYLENKKVFITIAIAIVVGIVFGIVSFINSLEKIYKEGHTFEAYGSTITVEKSYKTDKDTRGFLVKKNKFYIIVDLKVKNNYDQLLEIPYSNIYLRVNDEKKYSPIDNYVNEFSDFGFRFISTNKLKNLEERQVTLVYEIDSEYNKNDFRLEYLISKVSKNSESASYQYVKVDLKPKEFGEVELIDTKKIGQELEFKKSLIDGTKIKIEEVEFKDKYSFNYTQVIGTEKKELFKTIVPKDTSKYRKTIMRLNANITENKNLNPLVYPSLFEKFATVEYELNGKTYIQKPAIVDLSMEENEYTYLEVVKDVSKATKVTLVFTIRDKEYKYILVEPKKETETNK